MKVKFSIFLVGIPAPAQPSQVLFLEEGLSRSSGILSLQPGPLRKVDVLSVNVVLHLGCFHLVVAPSGTHDLEDLHVW